MYTNVFRTVCWKIWLLSASVKLLRPTKRTTLVDTDWSVIASQSEVMNGQPMNAMRISSAGERST